MRLSLPPPPPLEEKAESWKVELWQWFAQLLTRFRQIVDNAGMGFGDGINTDNVSGTWITYTTNATPNTEDTIVHNLGVVPVGWLVVTCDKAGVVYKGTSVWTTTSMFLKCSIASMTVLIFILAPSNQSH